MVVILLLTPPYTQTEACDGGTASNDSSTSTGDTAIPAYAYQQQKQQQQAKLQKYYYFYPYSSQYQSTNAYLPAYNTTCSCQCCQQQQQQKQKPQQELYTAPPLSIGGLHQESDKSFFSAKDQWSAGLQATYNTPQPQPQPQSQPQYLRQQQVVDNGRFYGTTTATNYSRAIPQSFRVYITNNNKKNRNEKNTIYSTNTSEFVRHVTRVNFYDVDTSQVEFESKDNHHDDNEQQLDTEAITKEEEWITKRKTELTTTRQIETRVKRQVVLEDGKVVEDSGPIVSTNTTEDTDKQETETTEKRNLGLPLQQSLNGETLNIDAAAPNEKVVAEFDDGAGGKVIKKMVARPVDGLVRESNEKRVISHEEVKDYLETEAIQHYGDFSDETYVKAVNSGAENLQEVLLSPASKQQLATVGPRIVKQTTQSRKTIDSENTQKRCLAQEDGTLVTESKTTTEHEIIADEDIPDDKLPKSLTQSPHNKEILRESKQRYFKQRDEQNVDLVVDGQVLDTEMRYAAETSHMEKEGSLERPDDWDSLSDRMRKMRSRTHQKTLMQQHKAALLADRKDALTKRPLDFDREEETRKGETMKWLESHFGSESTASNDSREEADAELEPTKKTYFNVTIKSNTPQHTASTHLPLTHTLERKTLNATNSNNKYYQGISNWAERKEVPLPPPPPPATTKHFSSKAFRDDLQETVARNRLRRSNGHADSRERLAAEPKDNYVSREDILQQKRQSLTAQYLARQRRGSREQLDEPDNTAGKPDVAVRPLYKRANTMDLNGLGQRQSPIHVTRQVDYMESRAKSYDRELNDNVQYETRTLKHKRRSPTPENMPILTQSSTLGRPTVPQRRRAIENKLRSQQTATPLKLQVHTEQGRTEPPPDYSPPPRSRSSSPDYSRSRAREYREVESSSLQRKQNQRTRFAVQPMRQSMATQTTETSTSNISTSTAATQKSNRRVSQVIGNSLRKLVSKIRSASAERKMKRKSKSKSREQSPATTAAERRDSNDGMPSYQQYNVIDSHIGAQTNGSNESERDSVPAELLKQERESVPPNFQHNSRQESDKEQITNPRQRYYLGEDPYSSTLYGKENLYDNKSALKRQRETRSQMQESRRDETDYQQHRTTPYNLARYQKSTNRIAGSTPNLTHEYTRSTQTLPRKLHEQQQQQQQQTHYQYQKRQTGNSGYTTMGHPERRTTAVAGPAKPARTYAKALNRSRSFSVHAMNGNTEPSSAYVEKMNRYNNNNNSSNLQASQAYKSNPHLYTSGNVNGKDINMLKSPSIVNLISRSQRDLSKIEDERLDERKNEIYHTTNYYKPMPAHDRIEEYTRKPAQYQLRAKHSLPVELNKDTASIIRRENEYNSKLHEKRTIHTYRDEHKRRGSGATIIDIRHK